MRQVALQVSQGLGQTVAPADAGQQVKAGEDRGPAVGGDGAHPGQPQPLESGQVTQLSRGLVSDLASGDQPRPLGGQQTHLGVGDVQMCQFWTEC